MSKFATLGVKIIELKLPCSIQQITTVFLDLFSPKMFFSLGFEKKIPLKNFQLFLKKLHTYKARYSDFLKNTNLRSVLVICQKL